MHSFFELLFWLLVGHAVADYAYQNEYVANAKNRTTTLGTNGVWGWVLPWHSFIHGGAVALATGYVWLGMLEVGAHAAIDFAKCQGWLGPHPRGYHRDQALHVACKVLWAVIVMAVSGA